MGRTEEKGQHIVSENDKHLNIYPCHDAEGHNLLKYGPSWEEIGTEEMEKCIVFEKQVQDSNTTCWSDYFHFRNKEELEFSLAQQHITLYENGTAER